MAERVQLIKSDLFAGVRNAGPFDLIVSNPPYIASRVIDELSPDVRDYEPRLALDGGPDGLAVFDRLISGAVSRLTPGGSLAIEIGFDQEPEAVRRLSAIPGLVVGPTARDADGHPRVVTARRGGPRAQ